MIVRRRATASRREADPRSTRRPESEAFDPNRRVPRVPPADRLSRSRTGTSRMKQLHLFLYGLFGTVWLVLGVLAVAGLALGNATSEEVHLVREIGAGLVFVGLMHLWCMRNYERRLPVHMALLAFAALFAGIHWHDWLVGERGWASPVINSVPLVVLAGMLCGQISGRHESSGPGSTTMR